MDAFFINSTDRTIAKVDYTGIKDLYRMVGGPIELAMHWSNGDVIYVNEEGLLMNLPNWFTVIGGHQPFAGNGVLVGREVEEGNSYYTLSPTISLVRLKSLVTFYSHAQVKDLLI